MSEQSGRMAKMLSADLKLAPFLTSITLFWVFTILTIVFVGVPIIRVIRQLIRPYFSPLRNLRGPKGSFFFGNLGDMRKFDNGVWHEQMIEEYGPVMVIKGFLGSDKLLTVDPKAVNHIVGNSMRYHRNNNFNWIFESVVGRGLSLVEGADHRRERKIMSPAFNTSHVAEMTEIFIRKSEELKDALMSHLPSNPNDNSKRLVNVAYYLPRATIDIIGLAGFNYTFNALNNQVNEFSEAFGALIRISGEMRYSPDLFISLLVKYMFPPLRKLNFDERSKEMAAALKTVQEVSDRVVKSEKERLGLDKKSHLTKDDEKDIGESNNLLGLIMRANARALQDGDRGLSDKEFAHQIPNFLFAGHETTAHATAWTLVSLALNPNMQTKLRNEIISSDLEFPTMEQLNSLSYLDNVIRESLRYHTIVSFSERQATEDDIIPVERPYMDRNGQMRDHIVVRKGDAIQIPLITINRSKAIWGEDAKVFNPDRWLNPPKASYAIPGAWGNQVAFGAGGPRGCIGLRFAVAELKALLFTLIKSFEFEMAVDLSEFDHSSKIVQRPALKSDPKTDNLPIFIRRAPTDVMPIDD